MKQLKYQLLKLKEASFKQGQEQTRKSTTNKKEYPNTTKELFLKRVFFNQKEILHRQSLPLQKKYKKKVQQYFSYPQR